MEKKHPLKENYDAIRLDRHLIREGFGNRETQDFFNKDADQLWSKSNEKQRMDILKKIMSSVSTKFAAYKYDDLTPELKKRLAAHVKNK